MGITHKDIIVVPVPLYHCFGMVIGNLVGVNSGATLVYPSEGFDPVASLEAVTKYRATALYGVPTMFIAYLEEYSKRKDKYDLSQLRTGFISGSGCPEALMQRIHTELGITELSSGYGMTELSPVVTVLDRNDPLSKKALTVGRAMPHTELKIVDPETMETLPWGETGEICSRGYSVMKGYFNDEAKSKESMINGWMMTGDLGHFDEDGYLKLIGRAKDMIIRGGENIYPREIEEYFMKHPLISDVQVIGVHDEVMGEEVCAWIKLKDANSGLTAEAILNYCQG